MRTVFSILIAFGYQITFGQIDQTDYEIFSDILIQLEKNKNNDRLLVSNSTIPYLIELGTIEPYFHDKTDKNLKLARTIFPHNDLLNEMWADTTVYNLIVSHNRVNKTASEIDQRFTKNITVDIFDNNNTGNWDLIYKLYPTSGGLRKFSRPAIIHDRAVVILEWTQAGNAGEIILLFTRRIGDTWMIEKTLVLGGE
jgi:hypothetical protein